VEVKERDESHAEAADKLAVVKRKVASTISNSHGLGVVDLVLVPPGSTPSGKVRRVACFEQYWQNRFAR